MSDIFREVDEDVRRDRILEIWKKYQWLIIAAAAAVILATGGWRAYQYWQTRKAESASRHYERAIELSRAGDSAQAQAELDRLVTKGPFGYRTLSRMRLAAERGKANPAEGAKAFDELAQDASIGPVFQDVAKLRAAILLMDTADPKDIRSRLEPLAQPGSPFRHTARELLALNALKANDAEAAGNWLDQIVADPETPPDLHELALKLQGLVHATKPAT